MTFGTNQKMYNEIVSNGKARSLICHSLHVVISNEQASQFIKLHCQFITKTFVTMYKNFNGQKHFRKVKQNIIFKSTKNYP